MTDPVQAAVGIIVVLISVGALLYLFYSRTNAVEKTGYGALIMLSIVALMIPIFWIMESNAQAMAKIQQHTTAVQRGAALANTADPSKLLMPAWSDQYGGPLTQTDIQYLFELIRSADPNYLSKNGYPTGKGTNGFNQVPGILQNTNPTAYQTAVAQATAGAGAGQFGKPVDKTKQKAVTINIIQPPPPGASCSPACFEFPNTQVKVGTTITWVNKSTTPHTVTAIMGENPSSPTPASQIFDSGASKLIMPGQSFTYTVTKASYNFNKDHAVVYYCQIHPSMVAELTIVQ